MLSTRVTGWTSEGEASNNYRDKWRVAVISGVLGGWYTVWLAVNRASLPGDLSTFLKVPCLFLVIEYSFCLNKNKLGCERGAAVSSKMQHVEPIIPIMHRSLGGDVAPINSSYQPAVLWATMGLTAETIRELSTADISDTYNSKCAKSAQDADVHSN